MLPRSKQEYYFLIQRFAFEIKIQLFSGVFESTKFVSSCLNRILGKISKLCIIIALYVKFLVYSNVYVAKLKRGFIKMVNKNVLVFPFFIKNSALPHQLFYVLSTLLDC